MYKKTSKSYQHFSQIDRKREKINSIIEENEEYLKNKFKTLYIGQVVRGKVIEIKDRWAIIESYGLRCFLHISQISNGWIDHPSDLLSLNEFVETKIVSKEFKKGKYNISVSTIGLIEPKQKDKNLKKTNKTFKKAKGKIENPFNPPKIVKKSRSVQEEPIGKSKKRKDIGEPKLLFIICNKCGHQKCITNKFMGVLKRKYNIENSIELHTHRFRCSSCKGKDIRINKH